MAETKTAEETAVARAVREAAAKLKGVDGKLVVEFATVRRVDAAGLREMETLASLAEEKGVKLVLRGASTEVYRVLKMVKLAPRFTFVN